LKKPAKAKPLDSQPQVTFAAAKRMITPARRLFDEQAVVLQNLFDQSNLRLHPLGDPLTADRRLWGASLVGPKT
jgi:hypothetical protein